MASLPDIGIVNPHRRVQDQFLPVIGVDQPDVSAGVADPTTQQAVPVISAPANPPGIDAASAAIGRPLTPEDGYAAPALPTIAATTPDPTADNTAGADTSAATSGASADAAPASETDTLFARYRDPNHRFDPATGARLPEAKGHSVWSRIAAAAMGWAKGGLIGGIEAARNPHYWEDQHDAEDRRAILPQIGVAEKQDEIRTKRYAIDERGRQVREASQQKIQAATVAYQRSLDKMREQAKTSGKELKEIKADPQTGVMVATYKDGTRVPVPATDATGKVMVDPDTGNPVYAKDPKAQMYDWVDPTSGQTVRISGAEVARNGATIAQGNAVREQGAATTNANNTIQVRTKNIEALNRWASDTRSAMTNILTQQSALAAQVPEFTHLQTTMGDIGTRIAALNPNDYKSTQDFEKAKDALYKEADTAMDKAYKAVGKVQGGQALVDALKQNLPPKPTMIPDAPKVAPSIISMDQIRKVAKQMGVSPEAAKADAIAKHFTVK